MGDSGADSWCSLEQSPSRLQLCTLTLLLIRKTHNYNSASKDFATDIWDPEIQAGMSVAVSLLFKSDDFLLARAPCGPVCSKSEQMSRRHQKFHASKIRIKKTQQQFISVTKSISKSLAKNFFPKSCIGDSIKFFSLKPYFPTYPTADSQ